MFIYFVFFNKLLAFAAKDVSSQALPKSFSYFIGYI